MQCKQIRYESETLSSLAVSVSESVLEPFGTMRQMVEVRRLLRCPRLCICFQYGAHVPHNSPILEMKWP